MTELELIVDFHGNTPRQGPGSEAETIKALRLLGINGQEPIEIADMGCGSGSQTLALAKHTKGQIRAVDLFPDFLTRLKKDAAAEGYGDRISTFNCSMDALPFQEESLDLIWSEGAIYQIGFRNGLELWRPLLKQDGMIALTEISWFSESRPQELEDYWDHAYPEMDTISNKIAIVESKGYELVGHFNLPEYCWTDNYYAPMLERFETFSKKHNHSKAVMSFIKSEKDEIELFNKYKDYYGYTFYLAKKQSS